MNYCDVFDKLTFSLVRQQYRSFEVFYKKSVRKNFAKFTGKTCVTVSFLIKFQAGACNFIKKQTLTQVISCEFCQIFKNTFFYRIPPVAASSNISGYNQLVLSIHAHI